MQLTAPWIAVVEASVEVKLVYRAYMIARVNTVVGHGHTEILELRAPRYFSSLLKKSTTRTYQPNQTL